MNQLIPGLSPAAYASSDGLEDLLQSLQAEQATSLLLAPREGQTGLVDATYIPAYLVRMLGALNQYLLLSFGSGAVDWDSKT